VNVLREIRIELTLYERLDPETCSGDLGDERAERAMLDDDGHAFPRRVLDAAFGGVRLGHDVLLPVPRKATVRRCSPLNTKTPPGRR